MMAAVGTTWAQTNNTIDLSTVNSDITVPDGYTLTGTLDVANYPVKISIDYGATVTLSNVTIIGVDNQNYKWAGITCLGNATLILVGTNTLKGFESHYPGIYVPVNSTLTLQGTGSLTASGNDDGAGIGGGSSNDCGNIVIAGGTITATGGGVCAPGIGAGYGASCGTINISGGNVTAKGALYAPGIGVGYEGSCGAISISGGTVTAKGGNYAAGIGAGYHGAYCVSIDITGGIVTAIGGTNAAGIGTGQESSCGPITITNGVTQVTATKGVNSPNSIGAGGTSTCNTVTIGGTVYWDGSNYPNGGNNAQTGIVKSPYYYPIQNYTLTNIPSGWTVTADGQTVPLTDGNASIQSGATVVLTPSGSDKPRVKSVTLTDPLTISLTVTKLSDGSWTFTMPVGNRTLNVEWWEMCDLTWMLGDQPVPSEGVTVCLGFENLLTLPTLSNPHNLDVRYGSTNENVARFDEDGFIIIDELSAGATTIYVVHDADEDYLYDSAYYMLTVLAPDTLTLAVNNSAMGAVSLVDTPDHVIPITTTAGTFKVIPGTNVNVTATPAEHHYMQKWNNEAALNSNVAVNTTFTVTKDTTLTAYFVHKPILTLKSNPSSGNAGHVDVDSVNHALPAGVVASNDTVYKYIVDYDTTVTVKAIPAPHYHLASWNNTGGNDLQQVVTMTSDMEITGVFAIDTFTLTLKTNDINKGTVEVTNHNGNPAIVSHDPDANGTRTYKVNHGAEVIIKASPENHYHLESWSNGAAVNTDDTIHVIVTTDSTIAANFDTVSYSIAATANPAEGGTVSGAGTYKHFTTCTLTATANTGYTFANWTKNGIQVSTNPTYSFSATEAGSYVANFTLNSYAISATANPTEGGTVTGGNTYHHGDNVTLTATANEGYTFVNWTKGGTEICTTAVYSFTATEATDYVANFTLNSYTITATANPTAGGTLTGAGSYYHGTICTLTATPATNYSFVNWTEGGNEASTSETFSFEVKGARTLVANFKLNSYDVTASVANTADLRGTVKIAYTDVQGQSQTEGPAATVQASAQGGSTSTLTAIPAAGYHFVNWVNAAGTQVSTENPLSVTSAVDTALTAVFDTTKADLAWSNNEFTGYTLIDFNNWKPTLNNPHNVDVRYGCVEGNNPDDGGVVVDEQTGVVGSGLNNFGHAQPVVGIFHIYAVHETDQTYYYDSVVYTLHVLPSAMVVTTKIPSTGGTVSMPGATSGPSLTHFYYSLGSESSANVAQGDTLNVLAEPAEGYHFSIWKLSNIDLSTDASYTYRAPANINGNNSVKNLRAVFDTNTYALNVVSADAEMGSVSGSNSAAKHFLNYEISAAPNTGYHFVQWNDGNTVNPRTVSLVSDSTFTAIFVPDTFTITYMDGDVELNVDTFYYRQPIAEYTMSKQGWDFVGWSPAVPELMPAENLTVYAQWFLVCNPVTDIDNNTYPSVNIGNICWMTVNMKATHYADGRSIANIYEYQNDAYPNVAENVSVYGRLYDWYDAVDTATLTVSTRVQGICPSGWYLPNAEDLAVLSAVPTPELRSTTGWIGCDGNTNSTGFTAYPAGMYSSSRARYEGMGTETSWWSTIDPDPSTVITPTLVITAKALCDSYFCDVIFTKSYLPADAISVRCVKRGE